MPREEDVHPPRRSPGCDRVATAPTWLGPESPASHPEGERQPGGRVATLCEDGRGQLRACPGRDGKGDRIRPGLTSEHDRAGWRRRHDVLRRPDLGRTNERPAAGVEVSEHDGTGDQADEEHPAHGENNMLSGSAHFKKASGTRW